MKACIFDLDGTLTDTLESLVYSVRATLREMAGDYERAVQNFCWKWCQTSDGRIAGSCR